MTSRLIEIVQLVARNGSHFSSAERAHRLTVWNLEGRCGSRSVPLGSDVVCLLAPANLREMRSNQGEPHA
jgi:hypothetical protein